MSDQNLFKGIFGTPTPVEKPSDEEAPAKDTAPAPQQQKQESSAASNAQRDAYRRYRAAVENYDAMEAQKEKAEEELENANAKLETFNDKLEKLKSVLATKQKEQRAFEEELTLQQSGKGKTSLKTVSCDASAAAIVREAKDKSWMTASQLRFMTQRPVDVCQEGVLSTVNGIEQLEKAFLQTPLYEQLQGVTLNKTVVKAAMYKLFLIVSGVLLLITLLAVLTDVSFFASLCFWFYGVLFMLVGAGLAILFTPGDSKLIKGIVVLFVASIGWSIGASVCGIIRSLDILPALLATLVYCAIAGFIIARACTSSLVMPLFQKLGFMKASSRKQAFKEAEGQNLIKEALYCYCNHDALMRHLQANAREVMIRQLKNAIAAKQKEVDAAQSDVNGHIQTEQQLKATVKNAQDTIKRADKSLEDAAHAIRRWSGQPTMEWNKSAKENEEKIDMDFSNLLCFENTSGDLEVLRHDKKPLVLYYHSNDNDASVSGSQSDQVAMVLNAFTKMNPPEQMRLCWVDMKSLTAPPSLRSKLTTKMIDKALLRDQAASKAQPGALHIGNAEDMNEMLQAYDRHADRVGSFVDNHQVRLYDSSPLEQINRIVESDGGTPYAYQVWVIAVPRDREYADKLDELLNRMYDATSFGLIPVLIVNEKSVHEKWTSVINRYKANAFYLDRGDKI